MQCSIGALYIIILFFEIRNYIKFKFYIIAERNDRHSCGKAVASFRNSPAAAFFVRCPFAPLDCPTLDWPRLPMLYCKTKNYLLYLFDIYLIHIIII